MLKQALGIFLTGWPRIQKRRKDLRIIVSSATLDAEDFKAYWNTNTTGDPAQAMPSPAALSLYSAGGPACVVLHVLIPCQDTCAILSVEGRQYPVGAPSPSLIPFLFAPFHRRSRCALSEGTVPRLHRSGGRYGATDTRARAARGHSRLHDWRRRDRNRLRPPEGEIRGVRGCICACTCTCICTCVLHIMLC